MLILYRRPDFEKHTQSIIDDFLKQEGYNTEVQWVDNFKLVNNTSERDALKQLSQSLDLHLRLKELEFDEYITNFVKVIQDTECFAVNENFEYIPSFKKEMISFFKEIRVLVYDEEDNTMYINGLHDDDEIMKIYKVFNEYGENELKRLICCDPCEFDKNEELCAKIWKNSSLTENFLTRINIRIKEVA